MSDNKITNDELNNAEVAQEAEELNRLLLERRSRIVAKSFCEPRSW